MKYAAIIVATYVAAVLQTSTSSVLPFSVSAALLTAVAVSIALTTDGWLAVVCAAAVGLVGDFASVGTLGINMAACASLTFAIQSLRLHPTENYVRLTVSTFFSVFLLRLVVMTIGQFSIEVTSQHSMLRTVTDAFVAATLFAFVLPAIVFGWRRLIGSGSPSTATSSPSERWLAASDS